MDSYEKSVGEKTYTRKSRLWLPSRQVVLSKRSTQHFQSFVCKPRAIFEQILSLLQRVVAATFAEQAAAVSCWTTFAEATPAFRLQLLSSSEYLGPVRFRSSNCTRSPSWAQLGLFRGRICLAMKKSSDSTLSMSVISLRAHVPHEWLWNADAHNSSCIWCDCIYKVSKGVAKHFKTS